MLRNTPKVSKTGKWLVDGLLTLLLLGIFALPISTASWMKVAPTSNNVLPASDIRPEEPEEIVETIPTLSGINSNPF